MVCANSVAFCVFYLSTLYIWALCAICTYIHFFHFCDILYICTCLVQVVGGMIMRATVLRSQSHRKVYVLLWSLANAPPFHRTHLVSPLTPLYSPSPNPPFFLLSCAPGPTALTPLSTVSLLGRSSVLLLPTPSHASGEGSQRSQLTLTKEKVNTHVLYQSVTDLAHVVHLS